MSLAGVSPSNNRREEDQATAAYYSSDEDEESSMLANLVSMFPSLDHEVVVSVLQAHNGCIQAAVEYLMSNNADHQDVQEVGGASDSALDPARDMVGQFSDDIGGLPEVLPSFLFDHTEDDEGTSTEDNIQFAGSRGHSPGDSPLPPQDGSQGFIDEPLPTYEEACAEGAVPYLDSCLQSRFSRQPETSVASESGAQLEPAGPDNGAEVITTTNTKKSKFFVFCCFFQDLDFYNGLL